MKYVINLCLLLFFSNLCLAQNSISSIEGYVYETNNRGFLPNVRITLLNEDDGGVEATTLTDKNGHFEISSDHQHSGFRIKAGHKLFFAKTVKVPVPEAGKKNSFLMRYKVQR